MRDIKCINNIVITDKSAECTFFVLLDGGLGSVGTGFTACLVFMKRWTSCNYFRKGIKLEQQGQDQD